MTAPRYTGETTAEGHGIHEWEGFRYSETGWTRPASKLREITRLAGEWPTDDQLLALADGDDPDHPSHFGGLVEAVSPATKRVTVYTD